MKKLSVYPLVSCGQDCSKNGLVYRASQKPMPQASLLLVMGTSKEILDWSLEQDSATLEKTLVVEQRILWGENHWYARPLSRPLGKLGMFGGNYVVTSDSRFKEFTGINRTLPIPVHDRYETQDEYNKMCV